MSKFKLVNKSFFCLTVFTAVFVSACGGSSSTSGGGGGGGTAAVTVKCASGQLCPPSNISIVTAKGS